MSKELDKTSLLDLVPDSISKDSDVSARRKALDIPLREMTGVLDLPSIYVSIDSLHPSSSIIWRTRGTQASGAILGRLS